jgi:hypothetical protein
MPAVGRDDSACACHFEVAAGHRVACHFYETIPAPSIAAAAGPAIGKFNERLAAFEAAKQARAPA